MTTETIIKNQSQSQASGSSLVAGNQKNSSNQLPALRSNTNEAISGTYIPQYYSSARASIINSIRSWPVWQQLGLIAFIAGIAAWVMVYYLWQSSPSWRPLMPEMNPNIANEVTKILDQERIVYSIDSHSGDILVNSSDLYKARFAVAELGVSFGANQGYELMDRDMGFGISAFKENAMYQRSLEGELARTISSLRNIRSARVHLALPKKSVFVGENRVPSASVIIETIGFESVSPESVKGIMSLVAASVPDMPEKNVSVVDQKGRLLSDNISNQKIGLASDQLEYKKNVEQRVQQQVASLLTPILGRERVSIEVNATLDFTKLEEMSESYNPDMAAVQSEVVKRDIKAENIDVSGGIPGSLSNDPVKNTSAPEKAAANSQFASQESKDTPQSLSEQSSREYQLDRTFSHLEHPTGEVKKLSVAVAIDNAYVIESDSVMETVYKSVPLTEQELESIKNLIMSAVGIDPARGDRLQVLNYAFGSMSDKKVIKLWDKEWFQQTLVFLGYAMAFILVLLFIIKPIIKNLIEVLQTSRDELKASMSPNSTLSPHGSIGPHGINHPPYTGSYSLSANHSYGANLEAIKGMVAEDPTRVAQVVRSWIK